MIFVPEISFAEKDAWISTLLGSVLSVLVLALWLRLQRKHPGMSLIQYGIKILGPWLGYPVAIYFLILMVVICGLIIEDLVLITSTLMLPNTPAVLVSLTFILVAVYACYKGVESIARMCELAFWPLTLLIVILPLLLWHQLGIQAFQPLWVINWKGVLAGTISTLVFPYAEIFVPVLFLPFVSIKPEAEKYYLLAPLAVGALLVTRTLMALMVMGPELLMRATLPIISLFRIIEVSNFLNRVEGVLLGIWYIGLLLKLAMTLYGAVLVLSQITGTKRMENLWLPVAAALFFISELRYPTYADFSLFSLYVLPFLALPGEVFYPLFLSLVSWFKGQLKPVGVDKVNQGHK